MSLRPDPDALGFVLIDVARMLRSAFERRIATAGLGLTPGEARTLVRIATLEGKLGAAANSTNTGGTKTDG